MKARQLLGTILVIAGLMLLIYGLVDEAAGEISIELRPFGLGPTEERRAELPEWFGIVGFLSGVLLLTSARKR